MLADLPTNNVVTFARIMNEHYEKEPELLGGNHTTVACRKVVALNFFRDANNKLVFRRVDSSNLTLKTSQMFLDRNCRVIISPLPLEDTLNCPRLRTALLCTARMQNDKSKAVKNAILADNLVKARTAVKTFLLPQKNKAGALYFPEGSSVWLNSHKDFQKPVYSAARINDSVKAVLSGTHRGQKAHIKLTVTCPDDVFALFQKIVRVPTRESKTLTEKKNEQKAFFISSARHLREFTLNYCPKEKLLAHLNALLRDISVTSPKANTVNNHVKDHKAYVNLNRMLNTIVEDLTVGDEKNADFSRGIGKMSEEGLYLEENFIAVSSSTKSPLISQLYGTKWESLKENALTHFSNRVSEKNVSTTWKEKVLQPLCALAKKVKTPTKLIVS